MIAVKHITVTLIVVALAACSKSHDTSPAFVPEQSYITGTIEGNVNDSAIYALVLSTRWSLCQESRNTAARLPRTNNIIGTITIRT